MTLRVTLSRGANVTLVIPAEVCREAEPIALRSADRLRRYVLVFSGIRRYRPA